MFSPDGRFVAYTSNESGRDEIYVQPFPGSGGKWSVSTDGGSQPVWAKDGRELYYRHNDQLFAVTIETDPAFVVGQPSLLFEGNFSWGAAAGPGMDLASNYDVSSDGKRFLMIKVDEQVAQRRQLNVVLNWFRELNRLVPVN
jgi:hypothetical protein